MPEAMDHSPKVKMCPPPTPHQIIEQIPDVGSHGWPSQHVNMHLFPHPQEKSLQGWQHTQHPQQRQAGKHDVESLVGPLEFIQIPVEHQQNSHALKMDRTRPPADRIMVYLSFVNNQPYVTHSHTLKAFISGCRKIKPDEKYLQLLAWSHRINTLATNQYANFSY